MHLAHSQDTDWATWRPTEPINLLVMFQPKDGGDLLARAIASFFRKEFGWDMEVYNYHGQCGAKMAQNLKRLPPDGHSIGMAVTETYCLTPLVDPTLGLMMEDFVHIGAVASTQMAWVVQSTSSWRGLDQLLDAARSGQRVSVGVFSPRAELAIKAIAKQSQVELDVVAVKSSTEGINKVLSGELDSCMSSGPHAPHVLADRLKIMACGEKERLIIGGNVKTFAEYGFDFATFYTKWLFSAPPNLPDEIKEAYWDCLAKLEFNKHIKHFLNEKMQLRMHFQTAEELLPELQAADAANRNLISLLSDA